MRPRLLRSVDDTPMELPIARRQQYRGNPWTLVALLAFAAVVQLVFYLGGW